MENNEKAYYEKVDIDNELKLRKQLAALPPYCKQYFIAIESKTQSRTRLAYAYDLSCFSIICTKTTQFAKNEHYRDSSEYSGKPKTHGSGRISV